MIGTESWRDDRSVSVRSPTFKLYMGTWPRTVEKQDTASLLRYAGQDVGHVIGGLTIDLDGGPGFDLPKPILKGPVGELCTHQTLRTPDSELIERATDLFEDLIWQPRMHFEEDPARYIGGAQIQFLAALALRIEQGNILRFVEESMLEMKSAANIRKAARCGIRVTEPGEIRLIGVFRLGGAVGSGSLPWYGSQLVPFLRRSVPELRVITLVADFFGAPIPDRNLAASMTYSVMDMIHKSKRGLLNLDLGEIIYVGRPTEDLWPSAFLASIAELLLFLTLEPAASSIYSSVLNFKPREVVTLT